MIHVLFPVRVQVVSNGLCFPSTPPPTLPLTPPIGAFQFYSDNFAVSVELCRVSSYSSTIYPIKSLSLSLSLLNPQTGSIPHCHLLANLCVLQRYSLTDPACVQSMLLAGSLPGESPLSPPLYYPSQSADEWLERNDINLRLSTSSGPQVNINNIIVHSV